jgi:long-chain acyl-CoA synthetase
VLVQDFLRASARRNPEGTALVCGRERVTYRELAAKAARLACTLQDLGVERGDRVVIHLPNSTEAVVAIFGTLFAGGVFVMVNAAMKADKLGYILDDCQARVLLTEGRAMGALMPVADRPGSLRAVVLCGKGEVPRSAETCRFLAFGDALEAGRPEAPAVGTISLDLACLIYTSGSTGEPKGVMSDHDNVDFASSSIMAYLDWRENDVILSVLPLAFDYGLYQLLMSVKAGSTLVLERSFLFPAQVLKRIGEERVTGFPGVPTLFAVVLGMNLAPFDLSSLRFITNTAAALPPSHIARLRAAFPGVTVHSMYGLTETKRTLHLPPEELDRRPGSVGIAIPGTEVWLEDPEGHRLGAECIGELVVRGRHVMRGYWNAPEATSRRFPPGPIPGERVCRSGDLFRRDEAGFYYFVGRMDDIIKSRGEKVAPKEVENVLHLIPGVMAAAVVGVPDPIQGEAVKAFLVSRDPGLTQAKVLAHCKAHLEDFMVPTLVEFRDDLPLNPSGKIDKRRLV